MKIIFAFLFVGILSLQVYSQNSPDALVGTKQMSVADANKLNGIAQPAINGKPYSQFKAEQEALKKQREAKLIAAKTNHPDATTVFVTNTESKTNVTPASKVKNPVPDDENPVVPAKQQAQQPVTKQEVKPVEVQKPQVPEQFKLPANQKWDGKPVPANNVETKAPTELPKVPQVSTSQNEPSKKAGS
jgi:hypothetical protein